MDRIISVQLSYFCEYHIQTTAENITKLMELLNNIGVGELLPSMLPGSQLNLIEGKAIPTSNLSFNTVDGCIQIVCMDNRIDCIIRPMDMETLDLKSALWRSQQLLAVIVAYCNIIGNRLAVNIDAVGNTPAVDFTTTKFGRVLTSSISYYNGKTVSEIAASLNTRIPIQLDETEETINVITNINTAVNNQDQSKLLLCHIDINTVPENQSQRFKDTVLCTFVKQVQGIIQAILTEFEEMANEDITDKY